MAGITDTDKDQKGEEDAHGGTESDSAETNAEQCAVNGHGKFRYYDRDGEGSEA